LGRGQVDEDMRLVATFLAMYNENPATLNTANLEGLPPVADDDRCRALLAQLFQNRCRSVPALKLHQRTFIRMLADRYAKGAWLGRNAGARPEEDHILCLVSLNS
jgi:hypothetical protein